MSAKSVLIALFQTGDVPVGDDYANMINSSVNLDEPTEQSMISSLKTTQLVTPQVSATNVNVTGSLTTNIFSLSTLNAASVSANSVNVVGALDAGSVSTSDVSANTVYSSAERTGRVFQLPVVISAAGTTQATGAALGTSGIVRLKGITNGTDTGFTLLANMTGLQQTVYVEENASCNLWPCLGGQINALSSNAAFAMAANTQYAITHIKASGYSVK